MPKKTFMALTSDLQKSESSAPIPPYVSRLRVGLHSLDLCLDALGACDPCLVLRT